jgi:hypothetical protein
MAAADTHSGATDANRRAATAGHADAGSTDSNAGAMAAADTHSGATDTNRRAATASDADTGSADAHSGAVAAANAHPGAADTDTGPMATRYADAGAADSNAGAMAAANTHAGTADTDRGATSPRRAARTKRVHRMVLAVRGEMGSGKRRPPRRKVPDRMRSGRVDSSGPRGHAAAESAASQCVSRNEARATERH